MIHIRSFGDENQKIFSEERLVDFISVEILNTALEEDGESDTLALKGFPVDCDYATAVTAEIDFDAVRLGSECQSSQTLFE